MAFLPGGDMLVTEKDGGLVRVARDGAKQQISGLPADLDNVRQDPRDNSGLFDVVLHPDFAANGRIYFSYSGKGPGGTATHLATARLAGDALQDVSTIFAATPHTADRFHYGGALLIGRDGILYIAVGERHFNERDNPPLPAAQDPNDRRGKFHRFTLDGAPAGGPFASGIRAVQGLAQDASGRIWFTEHGSVAGDEINILQQGANYGWPVVTSGAYRNTEWKPERTLNEAVYAPPAFTWGGETTVAPTGLAVYSGSAFPEWHGDLIIGGLSRGNLLRADIEDGKIVSVEPLLADRPVRIRNAKQGPDGALYILTDEADGRIIRLD
jgi:glucose/arabinose dehydrogenase